MTDLFSAPSPTTSGPRAPLPSRSSQRRTKKVSAAARRRRRRRRIAVLLLALIVVGGVGYYVYENMLSNISFGGSNSAKDYPGPGSGSVKIRIQPGDSGTAIGSTLYEDGVVESVKAFTKAFKADPQAASIQPGLYTLKKQMKASDAVSLLAANTGRVEWNVTIPEGFTESQIVARASAITGISAADFTKAMKDTKATGLPSQAKGDYEGWLFPATYSFDPDSTATDIVSQMVAKTVSVLDGLKVPTTERQEVLIKASIAEKEVSKVSDYGKVARVLENRLPLDGPTAGRLQCDTVLAYGLKIPALQLTRAEEQTSKSAYNVFLRSGLPPTPIASPGEAAIKATLHPTPGDWVFFVTVNLDTGETVFTNTYGEFTKASNEFHDWLAAHPQTGK